MNKTTVVHGFYDEIKANPDIHVIEISTTGVNEQIIFYPTFEQAIKIRDTIDLVLKRIINAKKEGISINPMLGTIPEEI